MKDNFAIKIENKNGREIIKYLVDKGYSNNHNREGMNSIGYYIVKDKIIDWTNNPNTLSELTIYTLEQLIESDFVLPKQWAVRVTNENADILTKWKIEISNDYYNKHAKHYIFISHSGGGISYPITYPIITFEQFKKHVLKENSMENENRKIIGYKLIKPEYTDAALAICHTTGNWENSLAEYDINTNQKEYIRRLTDAKVLDLWFKPVYKEEYKVGDWITITEVDSLGWLNSTPKRTFQIDGNPVSFLGGTYWRINGGKALHAKFRKATLEEIQQAQKTIVKMYSSNKGEFEIEVVDGKAYYRPENKHLPKEWIRDIINSYGNILIQKNVINPYNVEISSINVGCYHNCKKEDWENVYKLLK